MDVAVLKADLKAWERGFHLKKGRKPTKLDIKEDPISAKYKLHKQLQHHPKSTPAVEKSPSKAYLKSKSRPVESSSTSIAQLSNPFSPKKPKPGYSDCFTTPTKHHAYSPPARASSLESVIDATGLESQKLHSDEEVSFEHSLDNARKRLRGEPITPSPHRDLKKKRRISVGAESSGHALLTATDEDQPDLNTGVRLEDLNESPVKRQSGKYRPLFEEQYPKPNIHTNSNIFTRTRLVNEVSNMECDQNSMPPQTSPSPPSDRGKELMASPNTQPQFPYASPSSPSPEEGFNGRQLLSPSPEPALGKRREYSGGKKGNPGGEKAIASDESETVETVDWVSPRRRCRSEAMEESETPEIAPVARLLVHAMTDPEATEAVVQLPDQIKHVLSLKGAEDEAVKRDSEARGLFDRLMRGRHTTDNGAPVWLAGEWAGADDQDGSQDDWEGEGLEWASGEL